MATRPTSRMLDQSRLKRAGLAAFLGGVAFNALLAIVVIVGGIGGESDAKILTTSLLLTAASIGVISNAAGHERSALGPVPLMSALLLLGGLGMLVVVVWATVDPRVYYRVMGTLLATGLAGTYASLISLPRLKVHHTWLQWAAYSLAGAFAGTTVVAIWAKVEPVEVLASVGVLLAAFTIVIPVLARVAPRPDNHRAAVNYCPSCGASLPPSRATEYTCAGCGTRFRVKVLSPAHQVN